MAKGDGLQAAFLENSSRYLAVSSPTTSAHLMTERLALNSNGERASTKALRGNVCNACGTLIILGWNAMMGQRQQTTSTATQKQIRKSRRKLIQVCRVCLRETVNALAVIPNPVKATQPRSSASMTSNQATEAPRGASKGAEKASSKQRAKARKEKSGLQALLNKSKQDSATSSTLDLMDFMKA